MTDLTFGAAAKDVLNGNCALIPGLGIKLSTIILAELLNLHRSGGFSREG
jgi:hypothetical protein